LLRNVENGSGRSLRRYRMLDDIHFRGSLQMSDLFALAMPWWEFILRAVVVYVVVLGMVRLSGKRALGQITPFDVLLIVLLGNAVQNALLGQDTSLAGGLLLAATLILLNYGVGWLTTRSRRIETLVEGEPVLIARDAPTGLYANRGRRIGPVGDQRAYHHRAEIRGQ
jgi:hypothetical protein